jgi:phosphomannomutase|tara:strand:+ start:787 stop:1590 length:804 start_codon:yes stop_codon:yes gene_type:complete
MNRKDIVLFDMDGTLTPPRQNFDKDLIVPLRVLSKYADIGIVTGSDFDYLESQMKILIKYSELRFVTHLLPCNGTKHYRPPSFSDDEYRIVHEMDMQRHLGRTCFKELISILSVAQADMCYNNFPLTGHFISYRGSMVNWCPVGRNANHKERQEFIDVDNSYSTSLRLIELEKIKHKINVKCGKKVIVKLGGETSFDIYPEGWDKTYALSHFKDRRCWFVGDRCGPNGNDKEIYDALSQHDRGFSTKDTKDTARIIYEIVEALRDGQ